ncbi:GNAT family protein [Brachybacterium sp. GPGPB12]|uniref:GNAT family N-acetyltransferase n=1 Tax=Brachybacterium sp. GPGPB12 TaxID=3023517 RepID=UPI0031346320
MVHVWPLVLRDGELTPRPLRRRDRGDFERPRARAADWSRPWDATDPLSERGPADFRTLRRWADEQARLGTSLPLAMVVGGRVIGQITAGPIQYGAVRSAVLGYWVDREMAGRGLAPRAAALVIDHLFAELGLHRVEVTVRPENAPSLRVVQKLNLRPEVAPRGDLRRRRLARPPRLRADRRGGRDRPRRLRGPAPPASRASEPRTDRLSPAVARRTELLADTPAP